MSQLFEKRLLKCNQCGAPFTYFWDNEYWCTECGAHHSLIKLIVQLCNLIDAQQAQITKLFQKRYGKGAGGNDSLLSKPT